MDAWFLPSVDITPIVQGDLTWLVSHLLAPQARRLHYVIAIARESGVHALFDVPKVTVGTIHSVKGGEADVVMLFPDLSPHAVEARESSREGWDAVQRLFYVGMTRARDTVMLCAPVNAERHVEWIEPPPFLFPNRR